MSLKKSTGLVIVTALSYIISGGLGLFLAVPPGYATVIWPAAGVALGLLLLYGNDCLYGIWLGSFLINFWIAYSNTAQSLTITGILIAMSIALGAACQALVSKVLVKRFVADPFILCDFKSIFLFAALTSILSCLIAATWSNIILWLNNIVPDNGFFYNWLTWWMGDSIGVLIFTPLIFVFFAKPRNIWRSRLYSLALPLCLIFIISVFVFVFLRNRDIYDAKVAFVNRISPLQGMFQKKLYDSENIIKSIQGFYNSSNEVTRDEFKRYVSRYLNEHSSIQALSWDPLVLHDKRMQFIDMARKAGFNRFNFYQRKEGKLIVDQQREFYYPVFFIEPYIGNESALGFNLASEPLRFNAMSLSAKRDKLVATPRINLVQSDINQPAVILFAPIYKTNVHKENAITGFISGVFRIKTLITSILLSDDNDEIKKLYISDSISLSLKDITSLTDPQILFKSQGIKNINKVESKLINFISTRYVYKFGGRTWALTVSPTPKYLGELFYWRSWVVLFFIMLFIALVNLFLLVVSGQNIRIKGEVRKKTFDLSRMDMEKQLILESVGEGVVGVDLDGKITFINSEALYLLGYKKHELLNKDFHDMTHSIHKDGSIYEKESCPMHVISEHQTIKRNQKDYLCTKKGGFLSIEYTKMPIYNDSMLSGVVISFRDITSRENAEQKLELEVKLDQLTGLPNMSSFIDYLSRASLRMDTDSARLAVCVIDINSFKKVGYHHGYEFASNILIQVSTSLNSKLRQADYLARLEADKFILCLEHIKSNDEAAQILKRFFTIFDEPFSVLNTAIHLSISVGVAFYPDNGKTAQELISKAHDALYKANQLDEKIAFYK